MYKVSGVEFTREREREREFYTQPNTTHNTRHRILRIFLKFTKRP
jgi:hypothetical protein